MDGRVSRGRGSGGKRGGRGGIDSDSSGGEHRGRGRGGHHRGRGRRDHHRGRGRGGVAEYHQRDQDEGDSYQTEEDRMEVFSRRKLESNWDRYEESERPEPDDNTPTQRGTDYHVLLESAGDSFTQFRFSEEKDWEMDPLAVSQMSGVILDLAALAQTLQELPLHQRLNLEAELVQVSTPLELPAMTLAPKQEVPEMSKFTPPSAALKNLSTNQNVLVAANPAVGSVSQSSSAAAEPLVDDADEELDKLLSLEKPVSDVTENANGGEMWSSVTEKACEEVKDVTPKVTDEKIEEVKDKDVSPPQSAPIKQEMTEEDLEDWLDSMIS